MAIAADQRWALDMLAGSPRGVTESVMLAHGFTVGLLAGLVRDGLATAASDIVLAGKRKVQVTRVRITDAGRLALAL
jgi:hypothetical protein